MQTTCSVTDCSRQAVARGWCLMHYKRWRNHGSPRPEIGYHRVDSFEHRFWAKVDKRGPDDCWEWTGNKNHSGYGFIRPGGSAISITAHRASWSMVNGPIPEGVFILHSCDNKSCVNPRHLHAGTHTENMRESSERARHPRGGTHHRALLTDQQVATIKAEYDGVRGSRIALARKYGVCASTIGNILSGLSWRHIN